MKSWFSGHKFFRRKKKIGRTILRAPINPSKATWLRIQNAKCPPCETNSAMWKFPLKKMGCLEYKPFPIAEAYFQGWAVFFSGNVWWLIVVTLFSIICGKKNCFFHLFLLQTAEVPEEKIPKIPSSQVTFWLSFWKITYFPFLVDRKSVV